MIESEGLVREQEDLVTAMGLALAVQGQEQRPQQVPIQEPLLPPSTKPMHLQIPKKQDSK